MGRGRNRHPAAELIEGAIAGLLATGPAWFFAKIAERSNFPPPETEGLAKAAGAIPLSAPKQRLESPTASVMSHFAFGAGCGAAYEALVGRMAAPFLFKGSAFGTWVCIAQALRAR